MQTQILKVAMIASLLACAVGIAAFVRGAYDYSSRYPAGYPTIVEPQGG